MRYFLHRHSDGAGDSGPLSQALWFNEAREVVHEDNARPRVGVAILVGSPYARTYSHQDWWRTTMVTEIIEDTPNKVIFKTKNSTYTWECA